MLFLIQHRNKLWKGTKLYEILVLMTRLGLFRSDLRPRDLNSDRAVTSIRKNTVHYPQFCFKKWIGSHIANMWYFALCVWGIDST